MNSSSRLSCLMLLLLLLLLFLSLVVFLEQTQLLDQRLVLVLQQLHAVLQTLQVLLLLPPTLPRRLPTHTTQLEDCDFQKLIRFDFQNFDSIRFFLMSNLQSDDIKSNTTNLVCKLDSQTRTSQDPDVAKSSNGGQAMFFNCSRKFRSSAFLEFERIEKDEKPL